MDYKKTDSAHSTITRNVIDMAKDTGNIYESVSIIGKRANQISMEIKEELDGKLQEFATHTDNLEEIFENREQIEISKYYESLPKPVAIAINEFNNGDIYFRNPTKEEGAF